MKRVFDPQDPELMDRPQPVTPALEADLRNLVSLNRWFGRATGWCGKVSRVNG